MPEGGSVVPPVPVDPLVPVEANLRLKLDDAIDRRASRADSRFAWSRRLAARERDVSAGEHRGHRRRPRADRARRGHHRRPRVIAMRIEGHTDNVPIRTPRFRSNWELSTARASAVIAFVIETQAFDPVRLSAAGYGEFHPRAPNDSAENRARNRRVDIVILEEQS